MPRTVFKLGAEVNDANASDWDLTSIPAKRWDNPEVKASRSFGAILKLSKN